MKLSDFNYRLQKKLIAQGPIDKRECSRLMVLEDDEIIHDHFYNLIHYLNKDDVLVINETKVLKNRLVGRKPTGTKVEVIIEDKLSSRENIYKCRIKAKKPRIGNKIIFKDDLEGEIVDVKGDLFYVSFSKKFNLEKIGELPTPFYVKKYLKQQERYQTVFAKKKGSLGAPTASLHFTKDLLNKIQKKGIKIAKICLHISFSTFLPIKEQDFTKHKMHHESFEVNKKAADMINNCKGRLICVGTTTVRTVESCADKSGKVKAKVGKTNLFICPGYKFKTPIKAMITNFHLPKSSLLLLVCAFYGRGKMLKAYEEAIKEKYRFYSFGDAMLILE